MRLNFLYHSPPPSMPMFSLPMVEKKRTFKENSRLFFILLQINLPYLGKRSFLRGVIVDAAKDKMPPKRQMSGAQSAGGEKRQVSESSNSSGTFWYMSCG